MKFVRPIAALVLTLAAVACGGGEDATVESSGAGTNVLVPSKETTGASIAVPGSNDDTASANEGAQTGGAGSESGSGVTSNETKPSDPPADEQVTPKPAETVQPAAVVQKYVPPECDADCVAHDVPGVISRASKKYNIPRWFYYAIIRRESTFDRCKTQPESAPNKDWGRGLTQVTFPWYAGVPYPQHVAAIDNLQSEWRKNMGLNGELGSWIDMNDVSAIPSTPATESDCRNNPKSNDAYDPKTNLDRFSTGFAAPAYHLYHVAGEAPTETLRKVAYHWHYGLWGSWTGDYPSDPRPYLSGGTGYDAHVNEYKAAVEAEDGVWSGPTCKAPYSDSGC